MKLLGKLFGVKVYEEQFTIESRGYDKDSIYTTTGIQYRIDKDPSAVFFSLNDAKQYLSDNFSKKGKDTSRRIRELEEEHNELETAMSAVEKEMRKIQKAEWKRVAKLKLRRTK